MQQSGRTVAYSNHQRLILVSACTGCLAVADACRSSGALFLALDKHHHAHARPLQAPPIAASSTAMRPTTSSALLGAFQSLRISPATPLRAALPSTTLLRPSAPTASSSAPQHARLFSATATRAGSWLEPNLNRKNKMMKGRPRVPTGGSTKGTTVVWGDYGLRMRDHHRRISAAQLKCAEDTIKSRMRGQKYRLYKRVACNVGVFVSGNEVRPTPAPAEDRRGEGREREMLTDGWRKDENGQGQGLVRPLGGPSRRQPDPLRDQGGSAREGHPGRLPAGGEQAARYGRCLSLLQLYADADSHAGQYEFVRKGDPPVVGITKLDGVTLEELKRPWKKLPEETIAEPAPTAPSSAPPPS